MDRNKVVLVDQNDQTLGEMEKIEAHVKGALHRAFSIFIFNSKGEMLIHQRSLEKYHSPGLWTNTCCSHPQLNETLKESALERLQFEMGFTTNIHKVFSFIYHAPMENGLIEHELDHVFIGYYNGTPNINANEVQNYKWVAPEILIMDIKANPENFTFWFRKVAEDVLEKVNFQRKKIA